MKEYASLVEELHIIVLCKKSLGFESRQVVSNLWIYPTNSFNRWFYVRDASSLGKKLVLDKKFIRGRSVITTQDPFECGWVGLRVERKWRLPLEVQLHTDFSSPYFRGALNFVRKLMLQKVLAKATRVRVVSEYLKLKVSGLTSAEISVLPIYVERERFEQGRITFDLHGRYGWRFVILAVARLEPEKNLSLAIRALALVRKRFPRAGLVIVGTGREEDRLKALVTKLGLIGAVEFVGWQNDLFSFYKTSDVFIQTSLFEGYGVSLVEAGLAGLPIVTTQVGLAQELEHGKDAYIYLPNDLNSFVGGILDLIDNEGKRNFLKMNLKQSLETKIFSKKDYLERLKSGWESICRK